MCEGVWVNGFVRGWEDWAYGGIGPQSTKKDRKIKNEKIIVIIMTIIKE